MELAPSALPSSLPLCRPWLRARFLLAEKAGVTVRLAREEGEEEGRLLKEEEVEEEVLRVSRQTTVEEVRLVSNIVRIVIGIFKCQLQSAFKNGVNDAGM